MANVAVNLQGQMPPNFFCFISRVYDPDTRKIVQKNLGHSDSVRCIIHIPERSQVFIVFFFTVVVISLLGTVWYDFENRVQTSGVEMRLRILCHNFMVFRPQTPRMSNFECSWVCFQFLLTRYLTLFFQYISASWDKTVRIWNAYKKSEFLGLCQLISFVST